MGAEASLPQARAESANPFVKSASSICGKFISAGRSEANLVVEMYPGAIPVD